MFTKGNQLWRKRTDIESKSMPRTTLPENLDPPILPDSEGKYPLTLKLRLTEKTLFYLQTICEGRGETFSHCVARAIEHCAENAIL